MRARLFIASIGYLALVLPLGATSADESLEKKIEDSIRKGVAFLVADQNKNGSWGSARQTKGLNIYAPVPGAHHAFRTAVTAMAVSALIESGMAEEPGDESEALKKGVDYLLEELPKVRRASADTMYNVWTHAYGLEALAKLHERETDSARKEKLREVMRSQIDLLQRYESVDGGWGYYDFRVGTVKPASSSNSFVSATVLVALYDLGSIPEVKFPPEIVDRALVSINRQRKEDNTYLYKESHWMRPAYEINLPAGSLGRTQACNYALHLWGDETISVEVIDEWLSRLWKRNGWLDIGRKRPVPHEAWFAIAGYFYYYGHYYAGRSLTLLPDDLRARHAESLANTIMALQESDGSWWDYPLYSYHQPYGTAYAILTLDYCR